MADFNDTFTGSSGDLTGHTADSGETWSKISDGTSSWTLNGAGLVVNDGGSIGNIGLYWSSWTPASADYSGRFTFINGTSPATCSVGFVLRGNGGATQGISNYYLVRYDTGAGAYQVYKCTTGSFAQLGSNISHAAPSDNDYFQADISGSSTTTIAVSFNGTTIGTVNDSSSPFTSAGQTGIWGGGGEVLTTGLVCTRLQAGALSGGGSATAFTLTGPTRGPANAASATFTVTPNGTTTATWTPNAQSGCTFTPSTITLADTTPKSFTVTRSTAGSSTINGTASGLTPPTSITYVATTTTTRTYVADGGTPATTTYEAIKNLDATFFSDRTSSDVVDQGGGTYSVANKVIPDDYAGIIQWDQGGTVFASENLDTRPASGGSEFYRGGMQGGLIG